MTHSFRPNAIRFRSSSAGNSLNRFLFCVLALFGIMVSGLEASVAVGDKAPPWELELRAADKSAKLVQPGAGHVAVAVFWAIECPASRMSVPTMNRLARRYRDRSVSVLAVTTEPDAEAQSFLDEHKPDFLMGLDKDGSASKAWLDESDGTPTAFLIGADGRVAWKGHPMIGLERVLNRVLSGVHDAGLAEKAAQAEKELQAALQIGDRELVLATLETLIALEPDNFQYHAALVTALNRFSRNEPERLKPVFERWAAGSKDCSEGLGRLVMLWRQQDYAVREPAAILSAARRAATLAGPEHEDMAALLAQTQMDYGRIAEAVDTLKKALASAGDDATKQALQDRLDYAMRILRLQEP